MNVAIEQAVITERKRIGEWLGIAEDKCAWFSLEKERDIRILKQGKKPSSIYFGAQKVIK